ncbi:DUF2142 domain-containing protein, partial [Streptomyces sp. ISL-66]|uniref:DUF2142 domain-containing protein n=1 Tax=Streptomyces sp. ISL-66 TaxID=2819186 RepID=UPI001BE81EA1
GVGAVVLVSIRPLGLIWFAGALVFGLLLARRGALLPLLRGKVLWIWTGLLGAATAVALLWASAHPDHPVLNSTHTPGDAARLTLGYTNLYVQHMIGTFGWLDPPAPAFTFLVWLGAIAVVVVLGISFGRKRETVALIGMLVAIVMVPVAAQASHVEKVGMVWQGRYLMPFAVGLPLMAVLICASRAPERGFPWRRLAGYCAGALALANAAAFFWTLRRFAVGTYGPWLPTPAHWAPPGGWVLWTGVYTAAAIALALPALVRDRVPAAPEPAKAAADADLGDFARVTPVR